MFIATKVKFDSETFKAVPVEGYEYDGPVDQLKKGREAASDITSELQKLIGVNAGNAADSYGKAQTLLGEDTASSAPGSLTPAAQAQLASDNDNIARTYDTMRKTAAATAGQRGYGSAPSGFAKTTDNAISQGEAGAQTGAYRNAQTNTEKQRDLAISGETALSGQQLSGEIGNAGTALTGAVDQSKMGSTAGDVLGGVAGVAGALPGVGGLFSKLGQKIAPSSVGAYGGAG